MLQLLDITQKNIIETRANDLLRINDYEKNHSLIHNILSTGKKSAGILKWMITLYQIPPVFGKMVFLKSVIVNWILCMLQILKKLPLWVQKNGKGGFMQL